MRSAQAVNVSDVFFLGSEKKRPFFLVGKTCGMFCFPFFWGKDSEVLGTSLDVFERCGQMDHSGSFNNISTVTRFCPDAIQRAMLTTNSDVWKIRPVVDNHDIKDVEMQIDLEAIWYSNMENLKITISKRKKTSNQFSMELMTKR